VRARAVVDDEAEAGLRRDDPVVERFGDPLGRDDVLGADVEGLLRLGDAAAVAA
jgi:hypothetical protein